jgi:hypothetical protein
MKKFIKWAVTEEYTKESEPISSNSMSAPRIKGNHGLDDQGRGMNFTVYSASGGKVIQIRTYDERTDRHSSSLYVITDKEDLGEELGLIITKESLCR